ncbi:MAG: hypothetical protein QOJ42_4730 [Acidobacteriaceae bacterium]|jgi:hypothetical protein|nr:hypothetical protein [Acidobacteriaceae bacterium]
MAKPIGRLARVAIESLNTESFSLVLTNEYKKEFRTAVNPEGLSALLGPLLKCIGLWAAKPALAIDTLVGPKNSIAAQRLSFVKGRNSTECAVRMYLGDKVEMTFLLPLDAVSLAIADLARATEADGAPNKTH